MSWIERPEVKVSGYNVDVIGVALWCLVGVDYVGHLTDRNLLPVVIRILLPQKLPYSSPTV
jgi:hypothetical protein